MIRGNIILINYFSLIMHLLILGNYFVSREIRVRSIVEKKKKRKRKKYNRTTIQTFRVSDTAIFKNLAVSIRKDRFLSIESSTSFALRLLSYTKIIKRLYLATKYFQRVFFLRNRFGRRRYAPAVV